MSDTQSAPSHESAEPPTGAGTFGLSSASFIGLLTMQMLTAVNDNIFRWLAIGIGKQFVDKENVSLVLSAGTASFVLPYLLLAAPAGYLADRFSKRSVIIICKFAEIVLMCLAVFAIWIGNLYLLFFVLAMMGGQSALFSPARMGSIPEMLRTDRISAANGLMGLTSVVAIVVGSVIGNLLADVTGEKGRDNLWLSAAVLIGVACAGWLVSFLIVRVEAGDPQRRFPWNAIPQTINDLRTLAANRPLFRCALGIMFFWSLGALAQINIDQFAFDHGATQQAQVAPLLIALVLGMGIGSVLAGVWSGGRVELGILPLGAAGIIVSSVLLYLVEGELINPTTAHWTASYSWACVFLGILGISAGLFDIPLESYMQHHSPPNVRGSVLAAGNFLTFTGILLMSGLFMVLRGAPLHLPASQIFLLCGIATIPVLIYIVWLLPQASVRFFVWLASKTVYRIRVHGIENLPARGGALLVSNHVSFLDAAVLYVTSSRPIRMIAWSGNFETGWMKWFAGITGTILINPARPKSVVAALRTAREAVLNGEYVCIFPEGGISRTGQMLAFRPGLMRILEGTNSPVVPIYLDGLWGSIFSFEGGKFFWKRPKQWPYPISIFFGKPIAAAEDIHQIRQAVMELGANAVQQRSLRDTHLTQDLIRQCKRRKRESKLADSTGSDLTGGELLLRSLILRRLLRRHVLSSDEKYVGVLLPPSAGGVIVNLALALDRRISANLNYTVSSEVMNACIRQAGIRHVLTSKKFMEKMDFKLDAEVVYLEDFKDKPTLTDKVVAAAQTYAVPAGLLGKLLGVDKIQGDDIATVIFTSGSTGTPKGVLLSYGNVASNVAAIDQVVRLTHDDVVIGILPFFHSFGYTVTLWTVMSLDVKGIYHFNPLDAKQIGKLCEKHRGTVLLTTPTFLRTYLRRCEKEEFASLDVVVAGAEKLPKELCDAFEQKFGIRPVEGYGTTELSPLVSVNVPPSRSVNSFQTDRKEGTVGRPIPGVTAKITDLDTGAELPAGKPGMLWIKGPNVMIGYLGQPDLTAEVIKEGWYQTGDVAIIDDEGFIQITGRESRFSKIGGEMVPHIKVEEMLNKVLGANEEEGLKAVVTAVPDPKKGERLVVIHTPLSQTPEELQKALMAEGLPNIYIPGPDSYIQVENLPILGTGKLDLKGIKQIAMKEFGN